MEKSRAFFLFPGIKAVLALLVALASAAAMPLVGLSAIMAGIRKAVGGGKGKPELPAAAQSSARTSDGATFESRQRGRSLRQVDRSGVMGGVRCCSWASAPGR